MACVLVVDDVPVVRLVICKILRHGGHSVIEAADGVEALQQLRNHRPDAVLTDLWMPGLDGLGLISTLRRDYHDLPVVAITGGAPNAPLEASIATAFEHGVSSVVIKPVDKDELIAAIDAALAARDSETCKEQQ